MVCVVNLMSVGRITRSVASVAAVAAFTVLGTPEAHACGSEYTVKSGDHMGRIANRCDVSVDALLQANKLRDPGKLRVGQRLVIPGDGEPSGDSAAKVSAYKAQQPGTELQGEVVNGRYCAVLITEDGTRYGLVSPKLAFTSGRLVTVQGSLHKYSGCSPEKTMLVNTMIEDGAEPVKTNIAAEVEAVKYTN